MTARGTWLDRLGQADFALVRIADGAVVGGAPDPSTELALHLECYRARPDASAVVHVHPQTSVLLAALGHPIRTITTDHAAYVGPVRVAPFRHPGTPELATGGGRAAGRLRLRGAVPPRLLGGRRTRSTMAVRRALNLEEAARLTYAALLLGDTGTVCPPSYRERLRGTGEH